MIPPDAELTARQAEIPAWDDMPEALKPVLARQMEVYAGFLEHLLDLGYPGWQERQTWRRQGLANGRTGALDLPCRTWRDRPVVDRGDGVFLAGDMVAAPGLLSEVSFASALHASRRAQHHALAIRS